MLELSPSITQFIITCSFFKDTRFEKYSIMCRTTERKYYCKDCGEFITSTSFEKPCPDVGTDKCNPTKRVFNSTKPASECKECIAKKKKDKEKQ